MLPQLVIGFTFILATALGLALLEIVPLAGQIILASLIICCIILVVKASRL